MSDEGDETPNSPKPRASPIDADYIDSLLEDFEGLWAYEDDAELRGKVEDLLSLVEAAQQFFLHDIDGEGTLFEFSPSQEMRAACLDLLIRASAVFDRAEHDDFEGLVDTARYFFQFPDETTDAQILAVLAIHEIQWAVSFVCDICEAYQEEITPYLAPYSVMRAEFKDEYFKYETEHRANNWWLERNRLVDSEAYKGRAQMLLVLANVAAQGIQSKPIQSFVEMRLREGARYERKRIAYSGGAAKRGHRQLHTKAVLALAKSWSITSAAAFRNRLANELAKPNNPRVMLGEDSEAISFWLDSANPKLLRYETGEGVGGVVSAETLKSILRRGRLKPGET